MKILMISSSFDIGGAETHILELCRSLSKMGESVAVASFGGEYVKELSRYGIRHYKINLISKNPLTLLSSYSSLKKLITKERFDVVHSHARMPSLLCDIICKQAGIPLVTTAHWVFSTRFPKKQLTRWGEKTLAVSEDIRDYLESNYKLKKEDITVTRNGIDTEKFSYGEANGKRLKICCVSRIDNGRAETAFSLVKIAPLLRVRYKNSEIIIIGTGDLYDELERCAKLSNEICRENTVKILGRRTNVQDFLRDCDIFVGVSRAALEAMSCGKPVILSGDEGYGGIFYTKNAQEHILTNFCCRGENPLSDSRLLKDLISLISLTNEQRKTLGKENRNFILENYSVDSMARDALSVYRKVCKISPKVIICGYYGYGNIGDELTLEATVRLLKDRGITDITVTSDTPEATEKQHGVKAIYRYNIPKVISTLKKGDVFMLGGGNLLQNQTSNRSLLYYGLSLMTAKRLGCRCVCFSCGVGELNGKRAKDFAHKVLLLCDSVFVRSERDIERIYNEFPKVNASKSTDLVFLSEGKKPSAKAEKYFLIALREPRRDRGSFILSLSGVIERFGKDSGITPVFIAMHPKKDTKITSAVAKRCKNARVIADISTDRFIKLLKNAEFSVGMRLHMMIASVSCLTPHISLPYDTKREDMYAHIMTTTKKIDIDAHRIIMQANALTLEQRMREADKSGIEADAKRLKAMLCSDADKFKNYLENLLTM